MMTDMRLEAADFECGDSASAHILAAVADHLGCDPVELPPLYDAVDPDAVEALFESLQSGAGGRLAFSYCDCEVVLTADPRLRCAVRDAGRR